MENSVCIDTDIIIDHLRGRAPGAQLYEQIITNYTPYTTYINKFELLCGAYSLREISVIEKSLLGFKILPFNDSSGYEAAAVYKNLKKKGSMIGIRDILIAGTVIANRVQLASNNQTDFKRIQGVLLWMPK